MGIISGAVLHQNLLNGENLVRASLLSVEPDAKDAVAILNLPGCCLGMLFFKHEAGMRDRRIAAKGKSGLLWTGYITDIGNIKSRLETAGINGTDVLSDSQVLLESYFVFGIESLQGLNGLYSIAVWDDKHKCFWAVTDRYGFTKLYYWLGPDGLMFASECKALITHPKYQKAIDKEGIVNFLGAGYCFGERTLFKDIRLIPQGSVLKYENSKLSFKKYWDYSVKPVAGNLEELTDNFFFHLSNAFKRCVNGEKSVFIPLSGGLDSRTLAGVSKLFGKEIYGCTIGRPGSRDVRYGRRIGQKVCNHHTVLSLGSDYIKKFGTQGVRFTDGTVSNHAFFILRLLDCNVKSNNLVSGFLGDVLTGSKLVSRMLPIHEIITEKFLLAFSDDELSDVLTPAFKSLIGMNSSYLTNSLNKAVAEDNCDKAMIVELRERQRRYTSYFLHELGRKWNVVAPFTINDFVDFRLTLPVDLRVKQKLYKKVIHDKLSFVADIPSEKTGKRMQSTWYSWRLEKLKKMVPANIKKIRYGKTGSLFAQKLGIGDNRNWLVDCDDAIRTGSAFYFRELFSDRERMVDLFNIDAVDRLFKDHMEKRVNAYQKICAIATIIEWRRQFGI